MGKKPNPPLVPIISRIVRTVKHKKQSVDLLTVPLVQIRTCLAEGTGFEPAMPCGTPVFETGTFDHSDTLPR